MSERELTPVTALVIAFVVMLIAVIMMVNYEQKNHIRDLQRGTIRQSGGSIAMIDNQTIDVTIR